jgi:mono/diheme cytochrome c family protein
MRYPAYALLASWLWLAFLAPLSAQDDDEEPAYRSGLVATITAGDGTTVSRVDEDIQFDWSTSGGNHRPDLRLAPNATWQARWEGRLFTIVPGTYRLHLFVAGKVKLTLLGRTLVDTDTKVPTWIDAAPFESTYGHHSLSIEYTPATKDARFGLYWSGPQFALEPIPDRHLFHDPAQSPKSRFEQGRLLAHALQCAQCHHPVDTSAAPRAPDLSRLRGQIHSSWIVDRLTARAPLVDDKADILNRSTRMPHFAMPVDDASAIAAWLLSVSKPVPPVATIAPTKMSAEKPSSTTKGKPKPRTEPSFDAGRTLVHSLGCLACHTVGEVGTKHIFGGGDLTHIADKRPADFFARWL